MSKKTAEQKTDETVSVQVPMTKSLRERLHKGAALKLTSTAAFIRQTMDRELAEMNV